MTTAIIILCALALVAVSGTTYALFWHQARGTEHMDLLARESGGRPWIPLLRGFASSLVSQAVATALFPLFLVKHLWLTPLGAARSGRQGPPVLFVHGYTHSASAWLLFARWFHRAGYTDLHATTYNSWRLDFPAIVAQLEREIGAVLAARPGEKIVLVGHSLGGLAIRQFLNTSPLRDRVLCAATMGTPHQGTTMAGLGMNHLGHSLAYKGQLIRSIEAADTPPPAPCLAVYSLVDNMVTPLDGLFIHAPGWKMAQTTPVCHVGMLYHRPTADIVLEFVDRVRREAG
ncbi:esterase/lipase family protein [Desulfocurvus sp. DL9XJH121]